MPIRGRRCGDNQQNYRGNYVQTTHARTRLIAKWQGVRGLWANSNCVNRRESRREQVKRRHKDCPVLVQSNPIPNLPSIQAEDKDRIGPRGRTLFRNRWFGSLPSSVSSYLLSLGPIPRQVPAAAVQAPRLCSVANRPESGGRPICPSCASSHTSLIIT